MKNYETPKFDVIKYNMDEKVMDGYADGDVGENPWADLFNDQQSQEDVIH